MNRRDLIVNSLAAGTMAAMGVKTVAHARTPDVLDDRDDLLFSTVDELFEKNMIPLDDDARVIAKIRNGKVTRVYYIDCGDVSKVEAEQYVKDIMMRCKAKYGQRI